MMRWVLTVVVVVAGVGVWTAAPAGACTCAPSTEAEHLAEADAVFLGEVTGLDERSAAEVAWTFAVDGVIKGDVGGEQAVSSAADSASCGLVAERGGYYLVFAHRSGGGGLSASLCGGTRAATPGEQPEGFPAAVPIPAGESAGASVAETEPDDGSATWPVVAAGVGVGALAGAGALVLRRRRN